MSGAKTDLQKEKIRGLLNNVYDIQKLRIAAGNRLVQSFNIQMGQKPSTKQEDMDKQVVSMINQLRAEYSRITDAYKNKVLIINSKDDSGEKKISVSGGIDKVIVTLTNDSDAEINLIKNKFDYELVATYDDLLNTEKRMTKLVEVEVKNHPMWDAFFEGVQGCGPLMAAVCLAYFDIDKARHVSSFWRYAGLDVVSICDGEDEEGVPQYHMEGNSKRYTVTREYTDKEGNIKEKKGITYNPVLKTKLCGVLGSSFLKKPGCYYEQIYRDYRARLAQREDLKAEYGTDSKGNKVEIDKNKARRHAMANRYMVKMFVRDLWVTWRKLEGYEVSEPYEVAKLGMKPHKYNEYHERIAKETQSKIV